jgi:endogenous inhibitor of DNA gyrase (YacG/DUF329 family)
MAERPVCVYCRQQPVDEHWRPFCSERCRMADLGRWLSGTYRVPGPAADSLPEAREERDREQDD